MSNLPEPPWSSRKEKPPPRVPITRDSITRAGLAIVDAEGLEALSMRRLADELNCQASALYGHVSGKSEVYALMLDHVAGEVVIPEPDPEHWQEQVKEVARNMYAVLVAHGDLAGASLANIPTGPNSVFLIDRFLALLNAGGLSPQAVAYAADLLPQFITASAYEYGLFQRRLVDEPEYFQKLSDYYRALPADRFPALAGMVDELMNDDGPDTRFEFGLDVIVGGLAALATK